MWDWAELHLRYALTAILSLHMHRMEVESTMIWRGLINLYVHTRQFGEVRYKLTIKKNKDNPFRVYLQLAEDKVGNLALLMFLRRTKEPMWIICSL